jgi:hypothetical protein
VVVAPVISFQTAKRSAITCRSWPIGAGGPGPSSRDETMTTQSPQPREVLRHPLETTQLKIDQLGFTGRDTQSFRDVLGARGAEPSSRTPRTVSSTSIARVRSARTCLPFAGRRGEMFRRHDRSLIQPGHRIHCYTEHLRTQPGLSAFDAGWLIGRTMCENAFGEAPAFSQSGLTYYAAH